jgi:excinuclease UvrABC nuclease subunit
VNREDLAPISAGLREVEFPHGPVVYFILSGDDVIYIGKSVNLRRRLGSHTVPNFFRVLYLTVTRDDQSVLEEALINRFRPLFNAGVPSSSHTYPTMLCKYGFSAGGAECLTKPFLVTQT